MPLRSSRLARPSGPTKTVFTLVVPLLLAFALAAPGAAAQDTDYAVDAIRVMQIIEGADLVADRPVVVRTMIDVSGPNDPPAEIDALMRVYVDGIEAADSPVYSHNGPTLVEGDSSPTKPKTMLSFTYIPPASNDVVFEVQLNPPGPNFVPETDLGNNTAATAPQTFEPQGTLVLMYSPIDYRPGGGATPNLPDNELIKPGVGDGFVQGIFPGSDIEYRRTDAPSKLWTSSLSGSGSSLNSSLANDLFLTSPQPDYIYGWVPGSLPYNGQAFINGVAAMGNTQPSRYQRTYAHELGHNFGLQHNSLVTGVYGEDVERGLWITEGLKKIKDDDLLDIMVAGQLTPSAWIAPSIHGFLFGHSSFSSLLVTEGPGDEAKRRQLLVSGTWNRSTGAVEVQPLLELGEARPRPPAAPSETDLVLRAWAGGRVVGSLPVTARSSPDGCAGDTDSAAASDPVVGFAALVPAGAPADGPLERLQITGAGTAPLSPVTITASAHAPEVAVVEPAAGTTVGPTLTVRWEASDADGDPLFATVRYSPDGEDRFAPLATHSTASELVVDLTGLPHFVPGQGHFEVLVSDGFHTARARSAPLTGPGGYEGAGGSPPFVDIHHPQDGFSFWRGANLILHSSGWDLEDTALTGGDIEWFSDLDGLVGTGRRFLVDDLSVGTHEITVVATDSGGQQTSVSRTITIDDRELPSTSGEICAVDLGFGGPGSATVSMCGGDLSAGGTADMLLAGAPASTAAFLVLGLVNDPVPLKGGMLVPFPWSSLIPQQTDAGGQIEILGITGIGTPLTVFLQYVIADGTQPEGYGFSNALQVQF